MIYNIIASVLLLGGAAGIVTGEITGINEIKDFGVINYIAIATVGALLYIVKLMSSYMIKQADTREQTIVNMTKVSAETIKEMTVKFTDTLNEIIRKCSK